MKKGFLFLLLMKLLAAGGQNIELGIPLGHESSIRQLELTKNQKLYITAASGDKEVLVWNAEDGKLLRRLSGHEGVINHFVLITDSLLLTTDDNEVRFWDLTDGSSQVLLQDFLVRNLFKLKGNRVLAAGLKELKYISFSVSINSKTDSAFKQSKDKISGFSIQYDIRSMKADEAFGYYYRSVQYDSFFVASRNFYKKKGLIQSRTRIVNLENGKCLVKHSEPAPDILQTRFDNPGFILNSKGHVVYRAGFGKIEKFDRQGVLLAKVQLDSGFPNAMVQSPDSSFIAVLTHKALLILHSGDFSVLYRTDLPLNSYQNHRYNHIQWNPQSDEIYCYSGYGYDVPSFKLHIKTGKHYQLKKRIIRFYETGKQVYILAEDDNIFRIEDTAFSKRMFAGIETAGVQKAWILPRFDSRIELTDSLIRIKKFSTSEWVRTIRYDAYESPALDTVNGYLYFRNRYSRLSACNLSTDSVTEFFFGDNYIPESFRFSPDAQYLFAYRESYYRPCADGADESSEEECKVLPELFIYKMPGFDLVRSIIDSAGVFSGHGLITFIDTPYRGLAVSLGTESGMEVFVYSYVYNSRPVYSFQLPYSGGGQVFRFGPDGHELVIDNPNDMSIDFYNLYGEKTGAFSNVESGLDFSPDGNYYLLKSYEGIYVFNATQRSPLYRLNIAGYEPEITFIDSNRKVLIYDYSDLIMVELASGKVLGKANKINSTVVWAQLMNDTSLAVLTSDNVYSVWDMTTGDWLIKKYNFGNRNLTILPSGLFDSDVGELNQFYWVQGLETIEFAQLKVRYWEPGLWEKWMKHEKIRDVSQMQELKLHPEIEIGETVDFKVPVTVTKRSGGIGKIALFVNGKEVIPDLRKLNMDTSLVKQTVWVDLSSSPYLQSNGENKITCRAWSADGFVSSRGENVFISTRSQVKSLPALYAVICGISSYANESINLRYSVTDARAIHNAIKIASGNLFPADSIHLFLVASDTGISPDKNGIRSVFSQIAKTAKAEDVIVVYLSGHGITSQGENSDFYYLTRDAFSSSGESYSDPAIRSATSISSTEMIQWMNEIHANKQFMVIDACGSGKAVENLIARRSIDASQIKAIDRMRENTGMHIISGCAADAVSYEASVFGQGLLTYSLLEAMKGGSLRQGKFLDVSLLMQYSLERVPALASDIGGIQKPQVLSPEGSQSFDIGLLKPDDRVKIPLSQPKPVFIRSLVVTKNLRDPLGLTLAANDVLMNGTSGKNQKWVYFDSPDFPNAWQVTGFYRTDENNQISFEFTLLRGEQEIISKTIHAMDMNQFKIKLRDELNAVSLYR